MDVMTMDMVDLAGDLDRNNTEGEKIKIQEKKKKKKRRSW